jgi:hypothetical protein
MALVRKMAAANPLWDAPRIHGELLKLGIDVAERTVSRLMPKRRIPPSQTCRTFLTNHVQNLVSIHPLTCVCFSSWSSSFTIGVASYVTAYPTAAWTAQHIVDTFPDANAPSYLLRPLDTVSVC